MRCLIRLWLGLILIVALAQGLPLGSTPARVAAQPLPPAPLAEDSLPPAIAPSLRQALVRASPSERVRVIVRMKPVTRELDKWMDDMRDAPRSALRETRAAFVQALKFTAAESQRNILGYLSTPEVAAQFDGLRTYWIINGLALRATPAVILAIAQRDDVESVRLDEWVRAVGPPFTNAGSITETLRAELARPAPQPQLPDALIGDTLRPGIAQAPASGEVTWGVSKIRADQVWRGLGIRGEGVVVANIDGGVDWQHPALQASYRGWTGGPAADHFHNWFDATDEGAIYPSDANGHGTHTMGTMVGQGGVGVAPGARWMAVKGLNSQGLGLFSWIHSAFEFVLAPGGNPAYAPDVLNNSWSSTDGTNTEFKEDLAALQRAGIFVVFANGNRGPNPSSVGSPASLPGAIGVGATDEEDEVAYFSSRGPSPIDGSVKPVVSAPGVNVISTFPGGGYASYDGTSMAAPHVAGAAALLLSAAPNLSLSAMLYALTSTARPLTTTIPNNASGWGRIDAYNAVLSVLPSGAIAGKISDGAQPIGGATVIARNQANGLQAQTTTDANGDYVLRVPGGIYSVEAGAFGYFTATSPARLVANGSAVNINLALTYQPSGSVRGVVRDARTGSYITATVRALGTPKFSISNNNCLPCRYALDLPTGVYVLEARTAGYLVQTRTVSISDGALVDEDFFLEPTQRIAFVDSGAFYYGSAAPAYREAFDALRLGYDEYRVKKVPQDTPTITQLLQYDTVIWSAPFDSPGVVGASDVLSRYLAAGRNLLLTGQSVAFYDGGGDFIYHPYFARVNAQYKAKNFEANAVIGAPGGPLEGKMITFTQIAGALAPDLVTVLRPDNGQLIGQYTNAIGNDPTGIGGAGVWAAQCSRWRSAYYAFGLEAIASVSERAEVISRTLNTFVAPRPALGVEMLSRDGYLTPAGIGLPGSTITHVVRVRNTGDGGTAQTIVLETSGNRWDTRLSNTSVTLAPCATALVTMTVNVPATAGWNASDVITLTSYLQAAPDYRASVTFTSKTPAGILLVDDERFYAREADYLGALAAMGNAADHWDLRWSTLITDSPSITTLQRYPIVIWYNGYDWFDPLKPEEERALQQYLDGGGRLLFTSQAALAYTGLSPFVRTYLGAGAIDYDDVTSNVIGLSGTVLGDDVPGGSLLPFPYNWNLSSAVQPVNGAQVILRGDSGQPFGLARSNAPNSATGLQSPIWRTAFMPFAFEALPESSRAELMNRIIGWLSPLGQSALVADRPSARTGETVHFTLTLRADSVFPPSLSRFADRQAVSVQVNVSDGMTIVSSSLPYASGQQAGAWTGEVRAGDVFMWTFAARIDAAGAGTLLKATARISMNDVGLNFTRAAIVRTNAPILQGALQVQSAPLRWKEPMTVALRAVNAGETPAPQTTITLTLPTSLTFPALITHTASAGMLRREGAQLIWRGALLPGGHVEIHFTTRLPSLEAWPPRGFLLDARMDDGFGRVAPATLWLAPETYELHLPFMARR
ncbi:MAG: S8 family serine peptidase [Anaerolineae bacterium]|nr:S8 family serine peptidase [Candidatus Roseilinea sp.]MDW8449148.1 S8 family serine peptidase [Anaerolineae bacterium]